VTRRRLVVAASLIACCLGLRAVATTEPTLEDVRAVVATAPRSHPRLMLDPALLQSLRGAELEPHTLALRRAVTESATGLLDRKPVTYKKTGRRLLSVSREALLRISTLALADRLGDDPRFAKRAEQEILAVCAFPDWNPSHFLDTAEMTLAVAIGYDWLFDRLSPEARAVAGDAIRRLGIAPSLEGKHGWINGTNNWSQVCHAGMVAGALALMEDDPELAARIVQRAVAGVPVSMRASYQPDGAYPEGPGYWSYGTTFNVILLDCLRSALGSTFDLEQSEGFSKTGDYIAHVAGPTGLRFDYADCGEGLSGFEPALHWLGGMFGRRDWISAADRAFDQELKDGEVRRYSALAVLWSARAPRATDAEAAASPPLDYAGGGLKPIAVFRSAWNDRSAIHLGVCAGTPGSNHGHMDIGAFVFDALGVRWSIDLGSQNYESLESRGLKLWDRSQASERWTVYRLNNHAHSTLAINGGLQHVAGFARFTEIQTGISSPGCTIDLTPVYAGQAARATRRFFLPDRSRVIIEDRLEGVASPGVVTWQMTTRASIDPSQGSVALLEQEGRRLLARIIRPAHARWEIQEIAPHMREHDAANPDVRQLAARIQADAGGAIDLAVELVPQGDPAGASASGPAL
jgi:hypothetical protein